MLVVRLLALGAAAFFRPAAGVDVLALVEEVTLRLMVLAAFFGAGLAAAAFDVPRVFFGAALVVFF